MEPVATMGGDKLAGLDLFDGIDAQTMAMVTAAARSFSCQKGDIFLEQGEPVTRFFIILDGWCGASKGNVNGQESILQIFRRGEILPLPDPQPGKAASLLNLQALSPLRLAVLPANAIFDAMGRSPSFTSNILAACVRQAQDLRDHIEQLTLRSADERVGRFLLQMRLYGDQNSDEIVLPFDKALIAAYLGIKPETLSRSLHYFKENGFVIERNRLVVPDRQALCDYCDLATMHSCAHAHTQECKNTTHADALS